MRKVITLTEAAERLNIARSSITAAIRRGKLTPIMGGLSGERYIGVYQDEVDELAARKRNNMKGGAR